MLWDYLCLAGCCSSLVTHLSAKSRSFFTTGDFFWWACAGGWPKCADKRKPNISANIVIFDNLPICAGHNLLLEMTPRFRQLMHSLILGILFLLIPGTNPASLSTDD